MKKAKQFISIFSTGLILGGAAQAQNGAPLDPTITKLNACVTGLEKLHPMAFNPKYPKEFWHDFGGPQKVFGVHCLAQDNSNVEDEENPIPKEFSFVFATPEGFRRLTFPRYTFDVPSFDRNGKKTTKTVHAPSIVYDFSLDGTHYYLGETNERFVSILTEQTLPYYLQSVAYGAPYTVAKAKTNYIKLYDDHISSVMKKPMIEMGPVETDPDAIKKDLACITDQLIEYGNLGQEVFTHAVPTLDQMNIDVKANVHSAELIERYGRDFAQVVEDSIATFKQTIPGECSSFLGDEQLHAIANRGIPPYMVPNYNSYHEWVVKNNPQLRKPIPGAAQ